MQNTAINTKTHDYPNNREFFSEGHTYLIWLFRLFCLMITALSYDYAIAALDQGHDYNHAVHDHEYQQPTSSYYQLLKTLRCPRCAGQSIAESNAAVAISIKNQVRAMLRSGKSHQEIKDYLVLRYGETILFQPRFSWRNALLWSAPLLSLIMISVWFFLHYARRSKD